MNMMASWPTARVEDDPPSAPPTGATLGRAEAAGASGAMAAAVARGVGIAGGEGCAGIFKLLIAERNIAEQVGRG